MTSVMFETVKVKPHPWEKPLFLILLVASLVLWALLCVSIIGIIYALFLGVFFWFIHLTFITHIRGSTIHVTKMQLPEIFERVERLSQRIGLKQVPEVYLMESHGSLNAFATRFLGTKFVVLYSDLLEACGENDDALDFIIAHELGHIHRNHLRWQGVLGLGFFIPFLGAAYSRAREFTCDQYGFALSKNKEKAVEGLCILAAGPKYAAQVNKAAFTDQCKDVDTFWMKIGQWLSSYPPLATRLAVLSPTLKEKAKGKTTTSLLAFVAILLVVLVPAVAVVTVGSSIMDLLDKVEQLRPVKSHYEDDLSDDDKDYPDDFSEPYSAPMNEVK